jgi:outer membrane lipoprotein-sorting protein
MIFKNKHIVFLFLTTFTFLNSFCQSNEIEQIKCKDILQKVSSSFQKNTSSKFNFKLEISSEDINEIQNGFAFIKDEKYYYKTEEREVISDGINIWTYLPEDNECYIDLLADLDNPINPREIFTIWKEGFKFRYIKKDVIENELIHIIKMYPSNPNKSKYHTIVMTVNETLNTIVQASIKTKDGVTIKTTVNSIIENPKMNANQFTWEINNYPNVDEIDNR